MKTFATYALMATAMAVKLNMLQEQDAQTETERVEDMTVDDFSPEELECISMAVEGGLRAKGMKGEELEETKKAFHTAAEEGATVGDGVEELRQMGRDAEMSESEIEETLEKMFGTAHKCAEKKKERKEKEESEGEGEELAQLDSGDEAELKELMESTAADLGEKKLRCMGKAIKEGLKGKGMPDAEADAAVDVLAAGAEAGKKVKEGVDYLRTLGEEAGLDTDDQDEVLLEMAGKARECAERSDDDEEEVALAQEDDKTDGDGEDGPGDKKKGGDKKKKPMDSDSGDDDEVSLDSADDVESLELAQEDDVASVEAEDSASDEEGPSDDGEKEEREPKSDDEEGEEAGEEGKGGDRKGDRKGDRRGDRKGGKKEKKDDGEGSDAEAPEAEE